MSVCKWTPMWTDGGERAMLPGCCVTVAGHDFPTERGCPHCGEPIEKQHPIYVEKIPFEAQRWHNWFGRQR